MRKEKSKSGKVENKSRHSVVEKILRRKGMLQGKEVKMRNKALFIGIVAIALVAVAIGANANIVSHTEASDKVTVPDVPHKINYQGYLTDAAGNPITGYLDMTFRIYDSLTGGTQLWNETQISVHVENGLFNVILGSVNPIPGDVFPIDGSRWLETEIEGQTLTPRKEIVSVAYAFKANPDDDWDYDTNPPHMYSIPTGNVGIGTTTPSAKLDVNGGTFGAAERLLTIAGTHTDSLAEAQANFGIYAEGIQHNPPSGSPGTFVGANFRAYTPTICSANIGTLGGVNAKARHAGSGTAGNVYGLNAHANSWGGTITNAYGVIAHVWTPIAAGNIANGYGIYIDDNTGNIGNSYGLYQVGSDDTNYFAGKVGIGTTSPGAKLDVVNSLGDSWIRVGSDVPNSIGGIKMRNDARTWIIETSNDDKFKITDSTAGMHRLTVDTAGNVGIGTTTPQRKLHIKDVMLLEPRAAFPASASNGDLCVTDVRSTGTYHIYCYLNGDWRQLD